MKVSSYIYFIIIFLCSLRSYAQCSRPKILSCNNTEKFEDASHYLKCKPSVLFSFEEDGDDVSVFEKKLCLSIKNSHWIRWKDVKRKLPEPGGSTPTYGAYVLLLWALENIIPPLGYWLEFGVASGYSGNLTASLRQEIYANISHDSNPLYGFDTFEGLPESWGAFSVGSFSNGGISKNSKLSFIHIVY